MKYSLHIDLETLGITESAPVIQVGMALFDHEKDELLSSSFSGISYSEKALQNCSINMDTLLWWSKQPNFSEVLRIARDDGYHAETGEEIPKVLLRALLDLSLIHISEPTRPY